MSDQDSVQSDFFGAHQVFLCERLFLFLQDLHPLLRQDVVQALSSPGKLLSPTQEAHGRRPNGAWALLALLVAQTIDLRINPSFASDVALATECFICALDLLDDVEDEDQTPIMQALGAPRVLNVSTALLMLAQRILLSLTAHNAVPEDILALLSLVQGAALLATAGQHRDLLDEGRAVGDMTQEECIEVATGKAGSLMSLACHIGAVCAHADNTICELFSELGLLLGIAHQLDNDSHDLYYLLQFTPSAILTVEKDMEARSMKTDLLRQKKTLPVVLAAKALHMSSLALTEVDKEEYRQALHEGIIATWGIALLYRERAYDCLKQIEALCSISVALRQLLGFT